MVDAKVTAWPRPAFSAGEQPTKILFACFGQLPLEQVELSRERFGLPSEELARRVELHEHRRQATKEWFEAWWGGPFGVIAARDLGAELASLTGSDVCCTLRLELPDQPDLSPVQTVWALSRWLCARGARVVLDVHAFRFRTAAEVEALDFGTPDVRRDVKIVLETEPTRDGLHLLHTRGLCKFARPELLCFVDRDGAEPLAERLHELARSLMDGASAARIRQVAGNVALVTAPATAERALLESLGLEAGVMVVRSDGAPLTGPFASGPGQ